MLLGLVFACTMFAQGVKVWRRLNVCLYCGERPHREDCPYAGTGIRE